MAGNSCNIVEIRRLSHLDSGNTRALLLDDDGDMRFAISRLLTKCDCDVVEAASVKAAVTLLEEQPFDIIFSDLRIPGGDGGEEMLKIVVENYPNTKLVLMSCAMDSKTNNKLIGLGASACLKKPFYKDTCMQVLQSLLAPLKSLPSAPSG